MPDNILSREEFEGALKVWNGSYSPKGKERLAVIHAHDAAQRAEIQRLKDERDEAQKRNQRQWDLIRFCRQELLSEILITEDEYDELAKDHAAVKRLEDYDEIRTFWFEKFSGK